MQPDSGRIVINRPGIVSRLLIVPMPILLVFFYAKAEEVSFLAIISHPVGAAALILMVVAVFALVTWATPMLIVGDGNVYVTDWFRYLLRLKPSRTIDLDSIGRVVVRRFYGGRTSRAGYGMELHVGPPSEVIELRFGRPEFQKDDIQAEVEPLRKLLRKRRGTAR